MSAEENKNLALRSWEIFNQRNLDLIEEFYPPDFVWHEPDQDIRGYEQAKQFVSSSLRPSPTSASPSMM
jgi:SnoaL-like domain